MNHDQIVEGTRATNFASWIAQQDWDPLSIVRAEGVYFWDGDGRRYLDWSSQLFNVNLGHGNPRVIQAIQDQVARLAYASPAMASEPRARLGALLAEITPGRHPKSFFTLGGADAIENAIKMARLYSGRQKVLTRYRAYHGATFGAMSAGGDPRRLPHEPGVPWNVRVHDPYSYRSPLYRDRTREQGDQALVDQIADTLAYEGPENVAAILLEGYSGSSGVIQGGEVFWRGIQQLCRRHDILLIVDEVLSGFGRTGEWFGIDHYPFVEPDMVVMAKGLTSGYIPLGAVSVARRVADHFETHPLATGLTYASHPVGCAAAAAVIEAYRDEGLVAHAREMGAVLRRGLLDLAEGHPSVGDVRGTGLLQVLELVRDRQTRQPLSEFNAPLSPAMQALARSLREQALTTFVRWNMVFSTPPLIITPEQIQEGLDVLDQALSLADGYLTP